MLNQMLTVSKFSRRWVQVTLSFCLSFLLQPATDSQASPPNGRILLLRQITSVHGPVLTYVGEDAIRVCFTTFHGYLLAKAPTWDVALVNEEDRRYYLSDYNTWIKHNIQRTYLSSDASGEHLPSQSPTNAKYAGKACQQYIFPGRPDSAKFFGLPKKDTDKKACFILEKWFATPVVYCVPIAFRYFNQNGFLSNISKNQPLSSTILDGYADPLDCTKI